MPTSADYVIIGGGLAGCTLAARLHQGNPDLCVIIIEAGPNVAGNPLTIVPLACFGVHHSGLDYAYTTVPQKHLGNRPCYNAAAKALSGGSAINYGTWTRGSAVDYDHWSKKIVDDRWSYRSLLPYFRRIEHHYDAKADPEQHGFSGPIYTASVSSSSPNRNYPLREQICAAWMKIGHKIIPDGNNGEPLGIAERVENWRDGKRQPAAEAYSLTGIEVLTNTQVACILIKESSGNKVATGVRLVDGKTISATKEVILSAGAYRSPQLLMLSGIGDPQELSRHTIPTVVNSPDVGRNFHDHFALTQWWKLRHPEQGLAMGSPLWTDPALFIGLPADWIVGSQVPSQTLTTALRADNDERDTDSLLNPQRCHLESSILYVPAGAQIAGVNIPIDGTHVGSFVIGMQPTSRGRITLSSSSPTDPPVIDPNYYATTADRTMLRHGIRDILRLFLDTAEGREIVEREVPPEDLPALSLQSTDEEIDARVRRAGNTFYHPGGSAAMGKVVDAECRVMGVQGLRVVDASVLPVSISAHYQVCVYVVAERVADMILGRASA